MTTWSSQSNLFFFDALFSVLTDSVSISREVRTWMDLRAVIFNTGFMLNCLAHSELSVMG